MDLALYDPSQVITPALPDDRAARAIFYQRRRRLAVPRAAGDPGREMAACFGRAAVR
jgi:hypothetical protein